MNPTQSALLQRIQFGGAPRGTVSIGLDVIPEPKTCRALFRRRVALSDVVTQTVSLGLEPSVPRARFMTSRGLLLLQLLFSPRRHRLRSTPMQCMIKGVLRPVSVRTSTPRPARSISSTMVQEAGWGGHGCEILLLPHGSLPDIQEPSLLCQLLTTPFSR